MRTPILSSVVAESIKVKPTDFYTYTVPIVEEEMGNLALKLDQLDRHLLSQIPKRLRNGLQAFVQLSAEDKFARIGVSTVGSNEVVLQWNTPYEVVSVTDHENGEHISDYVCFNFYKRATRDLGRIIRSGLRGKV